jgi:hypothetical protein
MITATITNGELESITIRTGRRSRCYTAVELLEILARSDRKGRRVVASPDILPYRNLADILAKAAELFDLPIVAIVGAGRHRQASRARFAVIHVARRAGHTLDAIGAALGGRDHTTIMHGDERALIVARCDPRYAARLAQLVVG